MNYKDFIKALSPEQRRELTRKNNVAALIRLVVWLGLALCCITLIKLEVAFWPIFMLPLGIMLVFLFTLMHETTHKTAFATAKLNGFVATCCGVLILLPPNWFKAFHFEHHRHTQDKQKDPERLYPKPETLAQYFKAMSGLPVGYSLLAKLISNARGHCTDDFVAAEDKNLIRTEAQCMLLLYVSLGVLSVLMNSYLLLTLWVIPLVLGQPLLRLFLLAEHNGCPALDNMFENTRTTLTNPMVRFISWNMSYHTEHHILPSVPFHQLANLHQLSLPYLTVVQNGYWRYHLSLIKNLKAKKQ